MHSETFVIANQVDVALDHLGYADKPDITLAMLACLKRGGILVLDGSMTCPLPIDYSEARYCRDADLCTLGCRQLQFSWLPAWLPSIEQQSLHLKSAGQAKLTPIPCKSYTLLLCKSFDK